MTRLGWHIVSQDRKLGYSDKRTVRVGSRFKYRTVETGDGSPRICARGMHASPTVADAKACWEGLSHHNNYGNPYPAWLCRVVIEGTDYSEHKNHGRWIDRATGNKRRNAKFVGTHRTVIGMIQIDGYVYVHGTDAQIKQKMEARNRKNGIVLSHVR
jgi:hypothetical protein